MSVCSPPGRGKTRPSGLPSTLFSCTSIQNDLVSDTIPSFPPVAQSDILEGEELFTIPRDLVLSTHNSKLKGLLSQNLEELGPWLSLMLVMIYECLQGDNSTWAPYFRVLPQNFDTLMFWSPAELEELQGSAVVEKIGRVGAEESILESIIPVVRANSSLFPPISGLASYDGDAGAQALLNLAHIMGSLIMAYAFDVEKPENEDERDGEDGYLTDEEEEQSSKGMVPLADMLNADADRNNVSSPLISVYTFSTPLTSIHRRASSRKKNH